MIRKLLAPLRAFASLLLFPVKLLSRLAKFEFVDGRRLIRFPDGALHRAEPRAYQLRKQERKALRRNGAPKEKTKAEAKKAKTNGAKDWEEQVRSLPR